MGGDWSKNVPPVKSVAHRLAKESGVLDFPGSFKAQKLDKRSKDTVVRAHQKMAACADDDAFSLAANARINDGQVDAAWWIVGTGVPEHPAGARDILGWNLVTDVDKLQVGINREYSPLHCGNIGVLQSKVGGQGNYPM
jgi:hypothetical protein